MSQFRKIILANGTTTFVTVQTFKIVSEKGSKAEVQGFKNFRAADDLIYTETPAKEGLGREYVALPTAGNQPKPNKQKELITS